ncbi:hypothetical protein GC173_06865 [bacterium]|nr:hypothetical protein [bacterium]
MKLRTRTNSIRLRLAKGEIQRVAESGVVSESIQFPGGGALVYTLTGADGPASATLDGSAITIRFPSAELMRWAVSDEVALRADLALGSSGTLSILVEKDFECLHRSPAKRDEDADTFPHPRRHST